MGDLEHALSAYEHALRHNPMSLSGLTQVAGIARIKENYAKAIDYFQRVLTLQEDNGEVWSALGHCYLMQDDLQKAYSAYQQALYLLPNPKEDPKLWYGIGILYDRYGSLDHAEEAFSSVLRMDKSKPAPSDLSAGLADLRNQDFDKANEILFRLGIIYKQQGKYEESLACFDRILRNPPSPLAHADIWFQIGHVYEQQKDYARAKDAYERVVADNPNHAKVLQQLGWLYHQDGSSFQNQELAIQYLTKSLEADPSDAQSWYLLGRAYMAGQKYNKAYEAYQQAVYRDGRNPTFWCSIGVLYFQINQFRDALDAYSRAIRINPYIPEVWFDLGSLYESCNNQITDAIDAYARATELDPNNLAISQRLQLLRNAQANGGQLPAAPGPQDVHPTAYATSIMPPPPLSGPPPVLQTSSQRPVFNADSRGPSEISLPPPSHVSNGRANSPNGPFRGGPPPPIVLDETRHPQSQNPLAPMDVDRPTNPREFAREVATRPPPGSQALLPHPSPTQGPPSEEPRASHPQDPYFNRSQRPASRSTSPAHRSPPPNFSGYPSRSAIGPAQPSNGPLPHRSPRTYHPLSHDSHRLSDRDMYDRRANEHRDWEQERRGRHAEPQQQFYPPRSPVTNTARPHSPPEPSPRSQPSRYWDSKHPGSGSAHLRPLSPPVSHHEPSSSSGRRYDPRFDVREYELDRHDRAYAVSPEGTRAQVRNVHPNIPPSSRGSESPHLSTVDAKARRRGRDREETFPTQPPPPQPPTPLLQDQSNKGKDRDKRKPRSSLHKKKEESGMETPKMYPNDRYKPMSYPSRGPNSPEPLSSNGSSRSVQPSPTSARPPSRVVDEDYDEGVADALMDLAGGYRGAPESLEGPNHSPTVSVGSRHSDPSPRPPASHRNSVSSTRSHTSPSTQSAPLKRPLSPAPEEMEHKRSRIDALKRRVSSPNGHRTPNLSSRPSPIPFRTQPNTSHSPEARQAHETYPPSPSLPVVLPPHPRPIGAGHGTSSSALPLPPITTLTPPSTVPSPGASGEREDRMQVDEARSVSPPSRSGKLADVVHSSVSNPRSPPVKQSPSPTSDKKEA
ncbi:hypothetical protein AGABI2DRAFT_190053 [Agaricus bisporus var. bisporus H97]|uniref:hypothetical protein n=1 Tax=Agaricus bisporus var. bisporus (strain H97 / ATCC MYA-4626 / FGSC 10389) TaxID=936046 RepID=UPI00029F5907|nr:hypothetical protein AGABI2DRAFT_190053 [Agaricus bisporus var. bisporus H97]EKV51841.1 hypothetical protein AGABI2DRAFT_190053 [Agaricus bisporus var. bisporus H97]